MTSQSRLEAAAICVLTARSELTLLPSVTSDSTRLRILTLTLDEMLIALDHIIGHLRSDEVR